MQSVLVRFLCELEQVMMMKSEMSGGEEGLLFMMRNGSTTVYCIYYGMGCVGVSVCRVVSAGADTTVLL